MKLNPKLIELMAELKPLTPHERLEFLLDVARTCGFPELELAIINYWYGEEYKNVRCE